MKNVKKYLLNLSLKKKWTISSALIIFVSYAIISVVIYISVFTWLSHYEENNAIRTVDDLTAFFETEGDNLQQLQQNTGLLKSIVNQNQTVRIFNFDGYEVLKINDYSPAAKLTSTDLSTIVTKEKLNGEKVLVVQRPVQIGMFFGIMQLVHPLTTFHTMMNYVLTAIIIAGLGAILLALIISYYQANLLMKPITDLRDSMLSIREKGFHGKINFSHNAEDEMGDLLSIYESMIDELQRSFKRQQQFVSDASHELRTPIQSLEGHLSLIKRWGKDDPEVLEESLDTSISEVKKMKKIIEELLSLAKNEERDTNVSTSIEKVFYFVKEELQVIYKESEIHFEQMGESKLVKVSENALTQILRNIIENGIKYNDKAPKINVTVQYRNEYVLMEIEDNGIGIAEENLPRIFDRFYRVDDSRESGGGTGLGLSITKMLVEKYDISIEVYSKLGIGTKFILKIPLVK